MSSGLKQVNLGKIHRMNYMKMDEDVFGSNLVDEFILSSTIDNRTAIHEA
jgi:hypothetical protein